jgi:hypothetical protein
MIRFNLLGIKKISDKNISSVWSKTMLTGESRFNGSTRWGLNPGPSWQEAKG